MKDGRTQMAHKAEHAVDLDTGAIVAVTVQGADEGDTTTIAETAKAATEQVDAAQADVEEPQTLEEIIADKGYHSNQTMVDLDAAGIRSYVAEPNCGRRDWSEEPEAQAPVSGNRRRIRGRRGRRLMRRRGELIERSFAHVYDTGGMRRTHLRGHANILKRLLIHTGGFNLGLIMRHLIGLGTPRGLQGRVSVVLATLFVILDIARRRLTAISALRRLFTAMRGRLTSHRPRSLSTRQRQRLVPWAANTANHMAPGPNLHYHRCMSRPVVAITGASAGVGRAISRAYAATGARLRRRCGGRRTSRNSGSSH